LRRLLLRPPGGTSLGPLTLPSALAHLDAVFLDRDGTLNRKAPEGEYISWPGQVQLLDGAALAVRSLNEAGVGVYVVTNQRGVALGRVTMADVEAVNAELQRSLHALGARVDGFYVCPHDRDGCTCRKPLPGLLLQAQVDHPALKMARCAMVGDAESDVGAGRAAGTRTVRLAPAGASSAADAVVPDLMSAVAYLERLLSTPTAGRTG
jgi:D-glycero-D-manno-heptose 1,7-bisphosphate phosphatase